MAEKSLQEQYLEAQLRKMRKEEALEQEQKDQLLSFKRIQAESAAKDAAMIQAAQDGCMHIKPSLRTALAGQYDHHRNLHLICQYCGKEFENNVPAHLRPDPQLVGGPTPA